MMNSTRQNLQTLIEEVESLQPEDFVYRESATQCLRLMLERGGPPSASDREMLAAGLGRLILEDASFSSTALESRLFAFCNDYSTDGLL